MHSLNRVLDDYKIRCKANNSKTEVSHKTYILPKHINGYKYSTCTYEKYTMDAEKAVCDAMVGEETL